MNTPKIELVDGEKVRVQYTDEDLDILNKKNKTVGVRNVIYDAIYNNKAITAGLFREKVSEHKNSIKQLKSMIKGAEAEIKVQEQNIAINTATVKKVEEIIVKFGDMIKEVKGL